MMVEYHSSFEALKFFSTCIDFCQSLIVFPMVSSCENTTEVSDQNGRPASLRCPSSAGLLTWPRIIRDGWWRKRFTHRPLRIQRSEVRNHSFLHHILTILHIGICIYLYIYICIYVYIYMYICIFVYMYICVCIYIYMSSIDNH